MTELAARSISEIALLIRTRKVSPVEVVQSYLKRVDEINPTLNAIVTPASDVIDQAKNAENAVGTGGMLGPLHGVPLTIKDTIETKDLRSTSGSVVRTNYIPQEDAPAVARLRAAGAIILGKTNSAEMAMDYTADNPVFGRTNNPYDLTRTPGGSSGGEAVAIAACMSAGGLGSDLAGSIRIPSHFCGICGLKPTVGLVPGGGQFPTAHGPYSLGSVIGPMARTVNDLRLLMKALTFETGANPERISRKKRVAWYIHDGVAPVTPETAKAVEAAAQALSDSGFQTENTLPPAVDRGNEIWLKLFSRASVVQLRNIYRDEAEKGGNFVRWRLKTADDSPLQTIDEYIGSWLERDQLREELIKWMEATPLLLAPVGSTPAYAHDTLKVSVGNQVVNNFRAFSYSQAFNAFDLPAVVVPAGSSSEGLPIGVQVVGRPFAENEVLDAASIIEEALGGWQMPPMIANQPAKI